MTGQTIVDVVSEDGSTDGLHDCQNGHYLPVYRNCVDGNWYYS